MAYATDLSVVEVWCRFLTTDGTFTDTASDVHALTETQATVLQTATYNEINGWLRGAGFDTPIDEAGAILFLAGYEDAGTAMRCELSQRTAGFRAEGSETRAGTFRTLYHELRKGLQDDDSDIVKALVGFGSERLSQEPLGRLYCGGISIDEKTDYEDDDDRVKPAFYIGMTQHPDVKRGGTTLHDPDGG